MQRQTRSPPALAHRGLQGQTFRGKLCSEKLQHSIVLEAGAGGSEGESPSPHTFFLGACRSRGGSSNELPLVLPAAEPGSLC